MAMMRPIPRGEFVSAFGSKMKVELDFKDENGEPLHSLTQQCFKDECDIGKILRKYDKTGLITHVNQAKADYGDYSEVNEFQESLNFVIKSQADFNALPSRIRKRFGNDPGAFFEFVTDPSNTDEMVKLGLAKKRVEPDSESAAAPARATEGAEAGASKAK